jgi:hypothetical protein
MSYPDDNSEFDLHKFVSHPELQGFVTPDIIDNLSEEPPENGYYPKNIDSDEEDDFEGIDIEDGAGIHNPNLLNSDKYEGENIRFMESVSKDETIDDILFFLENRSRLSKRAQARMALFSACFQSKNTVYSVFSNQADFMQAHDDLKFVEKLIRAGLKRSDRTVEWETTQAAVESQALLRLRQSKGGMARKQLNTTVSESVHENRETRRNEERKYASKIPLIGRFI